jgi:DNA-binding FadR family transcriptional regulator
MSPAHLFEPTYIALKQRLVSGAWQAGARLEAARIASEMGISITPVRDCLNRLAGERIVDARSGEGFHVPQFDVQSLRRMFDVNQTLLMTAIMRSTPATKLVEIEDDPALRTARMFRHIAQHSRNSELIAIVENLSDRLHRLRLLDPLAFPEGRHDLDRIEAKLASSATSHEVRQSIRHYHETRRRGAGRLLRLLPSI